jgi:hypothetical protein
MGHGWARDVQRLDVGGCGRELWLFGEIVWAYLGGAEGTFVRRELLEMFWKLKVEWVFIDGLCIWVSTLSTSTGGNLRENIHWVRVRVRMLICRTASCSRCISMLVGFYAWRSAMLGGKKAWRCRMQPQIDHKAEGICIGGEYSILGDTCMSIWGNIWGNISERLVLVSREYATNCN